MVDRLCRNTRRPGVRAAALTKDGDNHHRHSERSEESISRRLRFGLLLCLRLGLVYGDHRAGGFVEQDQGGQ